MNPLTSRACHVVALVVAIALNAAVARAAEKVIATFNPAQGYSSRSGLTIDAEGNLYGIINGGGINNCGSVFELTPGQNGTWTESIIFSFKGCQFPPQSPVAPCPWTKKENLYGFRAKWHGKLRRHLRAEKEFKRRLVRRNHSYLHYE